MWSGPRNLSTAMMRSFGNRADCAVADEPFYAAYLALTGADHPMGDEILRHHVTDWRKVASDLSGPAPLGRQVFYQKHMTHHMVPEIGREWMRNCRHAFLIRHPARVLASYASKREAVTLADIGFVEQVELFERAAEIEGKAPPVVDADRLLMDPERMLRMLCGALGIPFDERMLSWEPGSRPSDGVWGSHWYDAVNRSNGFGSPAEMPALPDGPLKAVEARALPLYERLSSLALV